MAEASATETRYPAGIDLGTTNSCVAAIRPGDRNPVVIPNSEGTHTTPSTVSFRPDGALLVGVAAKRQALQNPRGTIASIKRFLGRRCSEVGDEATTVPYEIAGGEQEPVKVVAGGKVAKPEEIAALILTKLKADAEAYLGGLLGDVVITVPAYFNDAQRQAVKDAGEIAGLNVVRLLNEPTAAALAYGIGNPQEGDRTVIVFDLGGGTFDVSLVDVKAPHSFHVRATSGDNHLGGDDFDKAIVNWLLEQFYEQHGRPLEADALTLQRLHEAAECAKVELTSAPSTEIVLPFVAAGENGPVHLNATLTRAELNGLVKPLLERLDGPIQRVLDDAGVTSDDLDDVVLIGGMTRMPAVIERVSGLLGHDPHRGINPDEAVALGAALQAAMIGGLVEDVVLHDVTPLSVGIELSSGYTRPLIAANSPLPCQASDLFTTAQDNQDSVEIRLVQGERELASGNRLLGKVPMTGIPPQIAGTPQIELTVAMDTNGLLTVSAKERESGQTISAKIEARTGLSAGEIEALKQEADAYREHDQRTRLYAELANDAAEIRELVEAMNLDPERAAQLGAEVSRLEQLLAQQAPVEEIEAVRDRLAGACRRDDGDGAPPVLKRGRRRPQPAS